MIHVRHPEPVDEDIPMEMVGIRVASPLPLQ